MRHLGKNPINASKCAKRWSDDEVEQLIDLEENSCLWVVSNKDYYSRKKRERAYKQIEEKLGTKRAVIKAKIITTLRQQCWQSLRSFACTTQQMPTTPNIFGPNNTMTCCVRLHGPLFRKHLILA